MVAINCRPGTATKKRQIISYKEALVTRVDVDSGDIWRRIWNSPIGHIEASNVTVAAAEHIELAGVPPDVVALVEAVERGGWLGYGDGGGDPGGPF